MRHEQHPRESPRLTEPDSPCSAPDGLISAAISSRRDAVTLRPTRRPNVGDTLPMTQHGRPRRLRSVPALVGAVLLLAAGMVLAFAGMRLVVTPDGSTAAPSHGTTPGSTLSGPATVVFIG